MIKQEKVYSKPGIYQILNIVSGDFYIGSSMNVYRRMYQHQTLLRNNKHHSPHLQRSWNKYGQDKFEYSILQYVHTEDEKYLRFVEQQYLDLFLPVYNVSRDAISPLSTKYVPRKKSHTEKILPQNKSNWEEVKSKISNTVKSLWANDDFREHQLSCMRSPKAKSNYSNSMKIRWESQEYKNRLSKKFQDNFLLGKPRNNQNRGVQSVEDIVKIKNLYSTGNYTHEELGSMFSIGRSTVQRIVSGKSWDFINA